MSGCGVCMGHSPSWDGHDINCPVRVQAWKDKAAEAEIDRLRAELAEARAENLHGCPRPDVYEHAAVLARATRAEAAIARVRACCQDGDVQTFEPPGWVGTDEILRALDGAE